MNELFEWLDSNKIMYKQLDSEVIEISGFGKMFFQDMDKVSSIFKKNKDNEIVFNLQEEPSILIEEEIYYAVFKFGDNWYYTDLREPFQLNILKYIVFYLYCHKELV